MAQPPALLTYSDLERFAIAIVQSGLFGIKTAPQALALMLIAQAEGRHPALAARDYDVIQGRPSKKAEAMARDFLDAGGKVEWHALDDTIADATFSHPAGGSVRIVWDMARAKKAGLGGKDMWGKYPRQMLRSRTVSEGVRTVWPLATSGMYEPGEVSDMAPAGPDPIRGETIDATADQNMPAQRKMVENWQRGEAQREQEQREAEAPPLADRVLIDGAPPDPPKPPLQRRKAKTIGDWLDAFQIAANDLTSAEAADKLITSPASLWAKEHAIGNAKARYDAIITGVMFTWFPTGGPGDGGPPPPDDVPTDTP